MSNPIGGDRVKQTAEAEHIGPDYTGDNISAKKTANYVWNGSAWERMTQPGGTSGATTWGTNDIEDPYYGQTTADGTWRILKVTDTSVTYATVSNNGTVTSYTDAWTAKATLTYGRFDEAF
jgi:hypothetical protein